MTDAPERRRANQAPAQKADPMAGLKKFRVPVVITIIWLAVVSYNVAVAQGVIESPGEECPGHWHAGFSVWVEDSKVSFTERGPGGDASGSPGAGFHIHGDDGILHFHPGSTRCITLGDALEKLGVTATNNELTLSNQHFDAGTYTENATHDVVVFHKAWDKSWKQVTDVPALMGKQMGNGDQVMVAYMANDSAISVEDRQSATTSLEGGNYDPSAAGTSNDGVFIGITMATVFAIVAIMIWYNFAKKTW